jgi:hypothetical protein
MAEKAAISAVIAVLFLVLAAALIEYFVPLSVYPDFMIDCRGTLLAMENEGGLNDSAKASLKSTLESRGFTNVSITGTAGAKLGERIILSVGADYSYSKIASLFSRQTSTQHMTYKKTAVSRKVIN